MIPYPSLLAICNALQEPAAVSLLRLSLKAGYHEHYPEYLPQIEGMIDDGLNRLVNSQRMAADPAALASTTHHIIAEIFHKNDPAFWFNHIYHEYKTVLKPEADFQQLQPLLRGQRILDYGCGSGYLSVRLVRGGYQVSTTDVLDYRYEEARSLPFLQMSSPTDIPYPDSSIDTALVQAVLHHIDLGDLPTILQRLSRVARRILIKEDTYDLPSHLPDLSEVLSRQPLLQAFCALPGEKQIQALVLIDFWANAIAQGLVEMNLPFCFRSVSSWQQILPANGLRVIQTVLVGFEPGRMHQSCHVWFVCESQRL